MSERNNISEDALKSKKWVYLLMTVLLIAAAALTIVFINGAFGDGQTLLDASFLTPQVILCLFALLALFFVFDVLRLKYILRTLEYDCSFFYLLRLSFINVYVSAITPLATGGGFCQLYFLSKKNVPLGRATAATSIRTLLAVVFFMAAVPALFLVNPSLLAALEGGYEWILVISVVFYTLILIFLVVISVFEKGVKRGFLRFLQSMHGRGVIKRKTSRKAYRFIARELRNFNSGIRIFLRGAKKPLALAVLFTLLFLLTLFSFAVVLIRAMGYDIPIIDVYQAQVLVNFLMYFAFTPGATGIAEGGQAILMRGAVEPADITSLVLIWRVFSVYIGAVIGMICFYKEVYTLTGRRARKGKHNGSV